MRRLPVDVLSVSITPYRVFSRDVTTAMLASLNKRTTAMLVSPTNPLGITLCFLLFWLKNMLIDHASENTPYWTE